MQNHIISVLKKSQDYLSGEEISRQLKISRAGIWKYIQELRKDGYDIAAVPHLGYRLVSSPDRLIPREIQFELGTKIMGLDIQAHESVVSTMDTAFRLGLESAREGTVVCAETQTKGKGRLGRGWSSPKGKGIYLSIILRPLLTATEVARLTLLTAVVVQEAVDQVSGLKAGIKWPNDLLAGNRKLAGILVEMNAEMDRVRFVVIGIGLNVNTPLSLLPPHATSIKNEKQRSISRIDLIKEILRRMEYWYLIFQDKGFNPVLRRWKELNVTLGRHILMTDPSGSVEGEAVDVDEQGALWIRSDSGVMVKRLSGDVVLV